MRAPIPDFPVFALADGPPTEGEAVTVQSPSPPQPGNGGSPVLNAGGQVVGMFTLAGSAENPDPCRC